MLDSRRSLTRVAFGPVGVLVGVLVGALAGCGPGSPDDDAKAWVLARVRGDLSAIEKHSSPELYDKIRRASSPLGEEYDKLAKPELAVKSVTEEGDERIVVEAQEHGQTTRYELHMTASDGWRVVSAESEVR